MFELAVDGHTPVFEILVASAISIRTYGEVTLPVARRVFAAAPLRPFGAIPDGAMVELRVTAVGDDH